MKGDQKQNKLPYSDFSELEQILTRKTPLLKLQMGNYNSQNYMQKIETIVRQVVENPDKWKLNIRNLDNLEKLVIQKLFKEKKLEEIVHTFGDYVTCGFIKYFHKFYQLKNGVMYHNTFGANTIVGPRTLQKYSADNIDVAIESNLFQLEKFKVPDKLKHNRYFIMAKNYQYFQDFNVPVRLGNSHLAAIRVMRKAVGDKAKINLFNRYAGYCLFCELRGRDYLYQIDAFYNSTDVDRPYEDLLLEKDYGTTQLFDEKFFAIHEKHSICKYEEI